MCVCVCACAMYENRERKGGNNDVREVGDIMNPLEELV